MTISRRSALGALGKLGTLAAGTVAGLSVPADAAPARRATRHSTTPPREPLAQTSALQARIDAAAGSGRPVLLPPGTTLTGPLTLRHGTVLTGTGPACRLLFTGGGPAIEALDCTGIRLANFTIDGAWKPLSAGNALLSFHRCTDLAIDGISVSNAAGHGMVLRNCTGRIERSRLSHVADAAIFALDSRLAITGNEIEHCANNGIMVWRSAIGEDGSQIAGNRISQIRADAGGTGQNGNGINVYRAGGVIISGNAIIDCPYSAVRGNAASNVSMTGNHCQRIGEVALYAEFGFEGALIASNIVDRAATGISVTNFNEGGRLAVVQGNLIRNLFRREHEPADTRGHGIAIEADTAVSGNTIEGAPTAGILVGWGRHMRDVAVTGNVVRKSRTGILVSSEIGAGQVLIASNLVAGASDGAIRAHAHGRAHGPDLAGKPAMHRGLIVTANAVS